MPTFSFTVPVKKERTSKPRSANSSLYETIQSDVEGIVSMTLQADYVIIVGNDMYPIAPEDYACVGVKEVYDQKLSLNLARVRHIRSEGNRVECDHDHYLPFTPGCCVKGRLVANRYTKVVYYKIRRVYIDMENEVARGVLKVFRQRYSQIVAYKESLNNTADEQNGCDKEV